ncbi:MAG: peptidase M13, partial [Colwellia sp.]|nr:peptidase M13 [Colwellia sp.]
MKAILTSAVCSSLLLLSGCSNSDSTATNASVAITQKSTLVSGIDKANMDVNVRPQDNFYRYINGGWMNKNEIPDDKTAIGSFYDLRDKADEDVKIIIEDLAATKGLAIGTDEQKVADLFRSFMNSEQRNAAGISPIQSIITAINNLQNKNDLAKFFGQYSSYGINSPLALYISVDAKDSSSYAIHIWQNGLNLP